MTQFTRIPALYGTHAFTTADALRRGITPRALRNPHVATPFHGVHTAGAEASSHIERALHAVPLLRRGDRLSHTTALVLYGCPLRVPATAPVHIESPAAQGAMHRAGVQGHRYSADDRGSIMQGPGGIAVPLVSPIRALQQAAQLLAFPELVVACDHFLSRRTAPPAPLGVGPSGPRQQATPSELVWASRRVRGRGARRLRLAAEFARAGSESRMETLVRVSAEIAGLRPLELQVPIRDAGGRLVARVDLAHRFSRSVFEYDGEQHRLDRVQYLKDLRRLEAVRDAGWRVLRLHREDFARPVEELGERMLHFAGASPLHHPEPVRRLLAEQDHPHVLPPQTPPAT